MFRVTSVSWVFPVLIVMTLMQSWHHTWTTSPPSPTPSLSSHHHHPQICLSLYHCSSSYHTGQSESLSWTWNEKLKQLIIFSPKMIWLPEGFPFTESVWNFNVISILIHRVKSVLSDFCWQNLVQNQESLISLSQLHFTLASLTSLSPGHSPHESGLMDHILTQHCSDIPRYQSLWSFMFGSNISWTWIRIFGA